MIFPKSSYHPATNHTRIIFGPPLQKTLCSKSLQTPIANTEFRATSTLKSTKFLQTLPSIPQVIVTSPSYTLARAFRSASLSMGDSFRTDGVTPLNGHAVAETPASLANYSFPENRLKTLSDPTKTPLILMACGSLSVPEYSERRFPFY